MCARAPRARVTISTRIFGLLCSDGRISFRFNPGSHDEISISTSSGTFDVHKRKHKKNAAFVLLMFMLMHIKGSACLCLFHRVNQALRLAYRFQTLTVSVTVSHFFILASCERNP
jgi:hypothetical protein